MSCADFWGAGVAEVLVVIEAAEGAARNDAMADVTQAWLTAAWSRVKDLRPLEAQLNEMFESESDQGDIDAAVAARRGEIEAFRAQVNV